MDRAVLKALRERVRAADGPDRELDFDLACALGWGPGGWRSFGLHLRLRAVARCERLTASVDAAVALVERVLPGWMRASGNCGEKDMPWACLTEPEEPCRDFSADAPSEPLALIDALLTALIEQSASEIDEAGGKN